MISGLEGYVLVGGVAVTADEWSAPLDQAIVDRMNFMTNGEPFNAAGQRTGQITFSGPYEGPIIVQRGTVYVFKLGFNTSFYVLINARIKNVTLSNKANDGPRFQIQAAQIGSAGLAIV